MTGMCLIRRNPLKISVKMEQAVWRTMERRLLHLILKGMIRTVNRIGTIPGTSRLMTTQTRIWK